MIESEKWMTSVQPANASSNERAIQSQNGMQRCEHAFTLGQMEA